MSYRKISVCLIVFFQVLITSIPPRVAGQPTFRHFTKQEGAPEIDGILKIIQDRKGVMWFGTAAGLFSFDSHVFKKHGGKPGDPPELGTGYIYDIICDSQDNLWIGAPSGLFKYDKNRDVIAKYGYDPEDKNPLKLAMVYSTLEDARGGFWVGSYYGISYLNFEGTQPKLVSYAISDRKERRVQIRCLAEGKDGTLWMGTTGGLINIRKDMSHKLIFEKSEFDERGVSNHVNAIHIDKSNRIWVAFKTGGLYRLDSPDQKLQLVEGFRKGDPGSYPEITGIVSDKNGGLWLSTTSGLAWFDTIRQHCRWYNNEYGNAGSLSEDVVNSVHMDRQGGVWAGTNSSGIDYLDQQTSQFRLVPFLEKGPGGRPFDATWIGRNQSLGLWAVSGNRMLCLKPGSARQSEYQIPVKTSGTYNYFNVDKNGTLWGGGASLITRFDLVTGASNDYPLRLSDEMRTLSRNVTMIHEDREGKMWVGGGFGILLFNREKGVFTEVQKSDGKPLMPGTSSVNAFLEDSKGNIWLGGARVFVHKRGSQGFEEIPMEQAAGAGKVPDVYCIGEDRSGRIWFSASTAGLQVYDPKLNRISKNHRGKRTLINNAYTFLTDRNGDFWINTGTGGITRYNPDKRTIQTFDRMDGLPTDQVKLETYFQDSDGKMYFGTTKGVFSFNPSEIRINKKAEPIVFRSLKLFGKPVETGDSTAILQQPLNSSRELVFRHDQNIFTLDFALLNYIRSDKNRYAYMLEGFEKQWNYVNTPSATYTNLSPGTYTFLVKAANNDGYWTKQPAKLKITVLPPWWQTWYAYLAYLVIFAAAIYAITRFFWARSLFRKESELYQAKLDFFTNVSHEIRTHLTLIDGPLQKVFQSRSLATDHRNLLSYAKKNSDRLMSLVGELLEFRKMESGEVILQIGEQNLVDDLKITHSAFEHLFAEKRITTNMESPSPEIPVWYDASQMQKVFYNLLSNACKFTPEGGTVRVTVEEDDKYAWVNVIDNGRGIDQGHLEKVFESFFQVYSQDAPNRGYGIGLALSRKIVERHGGLLTVSSKNHPGEQPETCFRLQILKGKAHLDAIEIRKSPELVSVADLPALTKELPPARHSQSPRRYTVLLIEDNEELRAFTREVLENSYKILEAADGLAGINAAREHVPDLIVSDIMMPEMNGLDLCSQLKSDLRTSHIPIILLTARGTAHHLVQGLKAGADAYVVKPFDIRVLELKIKNLIRTRQVLQHRGNPFVSIQPDGVVLPELDRQFLARLTSLAEKNISDGDFGVTQMAEEIGISVSVLYRKVRALTGMTVNDFVKSIRMQRAEQLLTTKDYNVNEVALMVGFESRKYFSREFQKVYGKLPSKYEALPMENAGE